MTAEDDKRALDRLVAGLPAAPDDVADAVAARAIDRTIANESLLLGLADAEAVVRIRTARRAARMDDIAAEVQAQLRLLAATDVDLRVRSACDEALRSRGLADPDGRTDVGSESPATSQAARRPGADLSLWLRARVSRSTESSLPDHPREVSFVAHDRSAAPHVACRIVVDDDGAVFHATRLPGAFARTRLTVAVHAPGSDEPVAVAVATSPVTEDGAATIDLSAAGAAIVDVGGWQAVEIHLVGGTVR